MYRQQIVFRSRMMVTVKVALDNLDGLFHGQQPHHAEGFMLCGRPKEHFFNLLLDQQQLCEFFTSFLCYF